MNKKRFFLIAFPIVVLLFILALILWCEAAIGLYFFAGIMLIEASFHTKSTVNIKLWYEAKNQMKKYHRICFILFLVFLLSGTIAFFV